MHEKEKPTITEKPKRKWLDRFVTFLVMGGFLVIIVVVLGLFVAISILVKGC